MRSVQRFMRERSAVGGLAFIVLVLLCAVIGPFIDTQPPDAIVHHLIGFPQPPSFHIDRLRQAPIGYFFDVDTNGFGVMPDYAAQVAPRDRWCIAAYIRALQLSQNAPASDVPAGQKVPSPPPLFRDIGNGATLPQVAPATPAAEGEPK